MPKTPYDWSHGPAEIDPHSLAKHTILREYVERYVTILTKNGTLPRLRVTLVDGFAGGGEYVSKGSGGKIHVGSPLILIEAVRTATFLVNRGRTKAIDIDASFVFVEKERSAFEHLRDTLTSMGSSAVRPRLRRTSWGRLSTSWSPSES